MRHRLIATLVVAGSCAFPSVASADIVYCSLFSTVCAGTSASDSIRGSTGYDTMEGRGGNDKMYGFGGNDTMYGGRHNDTLNGGTGNDRLYGDARSGTFGNDVLRGDAGNDWLIAGGGNDVIYAQDFEVDVIDCGPGTDRLAGYDAGDVVGNCETLNGRYPPR